MAAFPALPFYTDAYLADTRHLTTEEHGAYLLLLMCAWRNPSCALEDDDKALARITGLTPTRWRRMRPSLQAFFDLSDGMWRQKKLTAVHRDVAARVKRNRISGARGGRALAEKRRQNQTSVAANGGGDPHGNKAGDARAAAAATKAKTKNKAAANLDPHDAVDRDGPQDASVAAWHGSLRALCGPDLHLDDTVIETWRAADLGLEQQVLPAIRKVLARELKRTGIAPARLGYYRDAVLEAASRQNAAAPPQPQLEKTQFDPENTAHWRRLLGDPENRFRGDYMAQNWFIPGDHPHFAERSLGANPRFDKNPAIPAPIYQEYGRRWLWR